MAYSISEQLLSYNRPGEPLKPEGVVVHSTANPGATAQAEYSYFNSGYRAASAHYVVDWVQIIRLIPENEVAWHAGPTANHRFLSVEMCEPFGLDADRFDETWKRAVWLVADMCVRYGWTMANVLSHKEVSERWRETDHTDPIPYFSRYNREWGEFLMAVNNEIVRQSLQPVKIVIGGSQIDGFIVDGVSYAPVRQMIDKLNNMAVRIVTYDEIKNLVIVK